MSKKPIPFLRNLVHILCIGALLAWLSNPGAAFADTMTPTSVSLSSIAASATGVTYTSTFTLATTSPVQQIDFQFSTTSGGSGKPAGINLTGATLGSYSGIGTGWSLSTTNATSGLLSLTLGSATPLSIGTAVSVALDSITNPAIGDCHSGTPTLDDICYLNITTYSDLGGTVVDNGYTSFNFHEDPQLSFSVESVPVGETHNGVTTTIESTSDSIAFGHLSPGTPEYAAHKLTISTNAPHGYIVSAYLSTPFQGVYTDNVISPFGAINATWSTPQTWATPTGTTPNTDTGWIGANTSDTRVTGWSSASAKFGPMSSIPHVVATSNGSPDRSGSVIYVTYGFGINTIQPADYYTGTIAYIIQVEY